MCEDSVCKKANTCEDSAARRLNPCEDCVFVVWALAKFSIFDGIIKYSGWCRIFVDTQRNGLYQE